MKLKVAIGIVCLLCGSVAFANSKEEAPAAAAPAADKPWVEVQNRVSALTTKNKQLDEKLKELIRTKKAGANAEKMKELDKEIQTTYDQWKQSSEELNRENSIFRYRFPERAAQNPDRVYQTGDVPSLQKVEELVGMEGKLQRNMKRMRGQYGQPAKLPMSSPEVIVEEKKKTGGDEKNIRDSDSPILRK